MSLKESKKGYTGDFGGNYGKGEIIYYNLKINRKNNSKRIDSLICTNLAF